MPRADRAGKQQSLGLHNAVIMNSYNLIAFRSELRGTDFEVTIAVFVVIELASIV